MNYSCEFDCPSKKANAFRALSSLTSSDAFYEKLFTFQSVLILKFQWLIDEFKIIGKVNTCWWLHHLCLFSLESVLLCCSTNLVAGGWIQIINQKQWNPAAKCRHLFHMSVGLWFPDMSVYMNSTRRLFYFSHYQMISSSQPSKTVACVEKRQTAVIFKQH